MLIGYFVVGLCALRQFGVQATLSVTVDDIILNVMDTEYFKDTVAIINEDDNSLKIGFTMIKEIPAESEGHFALYGLSMGEYNMPTGLDVDMTICDMIEEPIIIGPFFKSLGFVVGECPVLPGTYSVDRYTIPVEKLPDEFDENKYEGKFQISVDGKVVMSLSVIVDVENQYSFD